MTTITDTITAFYKEQIPADFLSEVRKKSFEDFEKQGFPTTRHEEWKYANVQPVIKQDLASPAYSQLSSDTFSQYQIPVTNANVLVFLNGHYQKHLSKIISSGIVVSTLKEAIATNAEILGEHFGKYANSGNNAFIAWNTAFATEGVLVHIPKNKIIAEPVLIYHISENDLPAVTQFRNLFVFEAGSQASVIQIYKSNSQANSLENVVTEIVVKENAVVNHFNIQQQDDKGYIINSTEAWQLRDSKFTDTTVTLGSIFVRNNLHIALDAENCEANMYGLYLLNGNQFADNHTLVDHRKPNSYSNELYKGILDGKSTGVFNGKIFVKQDAQKTNAYQSNRSIVLSPEATMNTKPQLEIFADDVKCSHGAAVGQLDDNMLFYMQARGIPKNQAKALLMLAFANDVIENIETTELKVYLEEAIERKLV
jgi:Fe-S cluster assembly protein SufD